MDSRVPASNRFAIGLVLRAVALGGLAYLVAALLTTTQLYATTLIVVATLLLVGTDFVRAIKRASAGELPRVADGIAGDAHDQARQVEHLQTLLDTVAAALLVVEPQGRIRFINRAAHTLFKGPAHQLRDLGEFDEAAVATLLSLAPGARQIVPFTDGRHLLCMAAQFSVPGRPSERLISFQRLAGELDAVEIKAWQDMTRVVAHEMMNSLTPIASLSESLEAQLRDRTRGDAGAALSDDVATSLEAIKRRSLGLMNFIERYRRVAELPLPAIQPVGIASLIAGIEKLVNTELQRQQVRLSTSVNPPDATFPADAELLEHAIINLLQNAADASERTENALVRLDCTLEPTRLSITVTDNGVGLPAHQHDRILLPFYSTKPDGSGIGLALVRHIALAHRGQLEIRANEPCGAVVSIILPVPSTARLNVSE